MMIVVQSPVHFDEFDDFDSLLHVCRGDVTLHHFDCGGSVDVSPPPFKKAFLRGMRAAGGDGVYHLVCKGCGTTVGGYEHRTLERSLSRFLTGPDWNTAPAQHLDHVVRFVPTGWPPDRRRLPDRRRSGTRYVVDRSMEGRRRRAHDRRANPPDAEQR